MKRSRERQGRVSPHASVAPIAAAPATNRVTPCHHSTHGGLQHTPSGPGVAAVRRRLQEWRGTTRSRRSSASCVQLTVLDEGSPNAFRARAYENALEAITSHRGDLGALSERELTGDRRHRPEHGEEDPRVLREGDDRQARGAAPQVPAGLRRAEPDSRRGPQDAGAAAERARCLEPRRAQGRARGPERARAARPRREGGGEAAARDRADGGSGAGGAPADLRRAADRAGARGRRSRPCPRWSAPGTAAACAGCARRSADVDIVAASSEPAAVREAFVKMPTVREVIGSGDTKTSVLTTTGLQVDLRVVRPDAVRRRLPVLHRLEGAQHQAAPARARARAAAERVRPEPTPTPAR